MLTRKMRYFIGILLLAIIGYGIGYGIGKLLDKPSQAQLEAQSQPVPGFQ